ncbi:MAG: type III-A CRISPR-associated protein Csm2, partial [Candidatus Marinimicrobia bacterium]|nr:type III-A CRISPR-associated protein Csm2 [Candidatus Neomarinimicrobiota bacterium]
MSKHQNYRSQESSGFTELNEGLSRIPDWIKNRIDKETITFTEKFGKYLAKQRFSNSQIRNIFGELKRLQMKGWNDEQETSLLLLKPKLAYSAKRQMGKNAEKAALDLKDILSAGIDVVVDSEDPEKSFNNFANLLESILAYHKAFG